MWVNASITLNFRPFIDHLRSIAKFFDVIAIDWNGSAKLRSAANENTTRFGTACEDVETQKLFHPMIHGDDVWCMCLSNRSLRHCFWIGFRTPYVFQPPRPGKAHEAFWFLRVTIEIFSSCSVVASEHDLQDPWLADGLFILFIFIHHAYSSLSHLEPLIGDIINPSQLAGISLPNLCANMSKIIACHDNRAYKLADK